jgi:4-amino-4-deoxy-L-arabinose transferase-like glycosyltransferase
MTILLRSRGCQVAGVLLTFLFVAVLNRHADGLWLQGDAPRHAINGLFWWDLLTALPRDPVAYALSYYARYPVIAPATYPPLFYGIEGIAFALFGPLPYVAKSVVLLFAMAAGLYTMAWTRRWVGPMAGWAGAFLAFVPGVVVWSNTVMLNMPATAFGLGSLYHFRRWLESARSAQLVGAACLLIAVLLTYYPGVVVLGIVAVWGVWRMRDLRWNRRGLWIAAAGVLAVVPLMLALVLAPVHTTRQLPTIAFLTKGATWAFYWRALPTVVGLPMAAVGTAGLIGAVVVTRWRTEAAYVGSWILVLVAVLSLLPARDPRYVLLAVPAFTIAAAMAVAMAAQSAPRLAPLWQAGLLLAGVAAGMWSASRVQVPRVSGFRELAEYLQQHAPADAVLYDGPHDGLFGFYVRASDPLFERRVVLGNRLLYQIGPTTTFKWVQESSVASTDDVVTLLHTRCGCRWVAIEVDKRPIWPVGERLLRQAVGRPEFELVRSFPIEGAGDRRVDLYRMTGDISPVTAVDLRFPSLSDRTFAQVVPVTR